MLALPPWMVAATLLQRSSAHPVGPLRAADPALVARVLRETGVETDVPTVGWLGWVQAVAGAAERWLGTVLGRIAGSSGIPVWITSIAILGVMLALVVVLALAVRAVLVRRRAAPPLLVPAGARVALPPPAPRDAGWWRSTLETRLAAGNVGGALEAAWWWVATSLAPSSVNPAWTSRELAVGLRRADLLAPLRTLDAWTYGPRHPDEAALRSFVVGLEKDLA